MGEIAKQKESDAEAGPKGGFSRGLDEQPERVRIDEVSEGALVDEDGNVGISQGGAHPCDESIPNLGGAFPNGSGLQPSIAPEIHPRNARCMGKSRSHAPPMNAFQGLWRADYGVEFIGFGPYADGGLEVLFADVELAVEREA